MAIFNQRTGAYADAINSLKQNGGMSGTQAQWKPKSDRPYIDSSGQWKSPYSAGTNYGATKKPASTGTSSGASTGGSSYSDAIRAAYEAQKRRAEEAAARKQQLAQGAYDKNMSYLQQAYENRQKYLDDAYKSSGEQLDANYNLSAGKVNQNVDSALRQAYLNRKLAERDTPQQLAALGISGGAAESTIGGIRNNYGNSRNNLETTRSDNLSDLMGTLDSNKAAVLQAYKNSLANDEQNRMQQQMALEQNLANGLANIETSKYDTLGSLDSSFQSAMSEILKKKPPKDDDKSEQLYNSVYGGVVSGNISYEELTSRANGLINIIGADLFDKLLAAAEKNA